MAQRIGPVMRLRLVADLLLIVMFVAGVIGAFNFSRLAFYMPLFAATTGALLATALFIRDVIRARAEGGESVVAAEVTSTAVLVGDDADPGQALRLAALQLSWFAGYAITIALIGVVWASGLFVVVFLLLEARMRPVFAVVSAVVTMGVLLLIGDIMNLRWPQTIWGMF